MVSIACNMVAVRKKKRYLCFMLSLYFNNYTTAGKSDYFGILASGLCLIHCFATPLVFIFKSCSTVCCAETPLWWKTIDYLFVLVSLIAIIQVFKATKNKLIKLGLIISWISLFVLILNESFVMFSVFRNAVLLPAFLLILLHIYNIKTIRYKKDCC